MSYVIGESVWQFTGAFFYSASQLSVLMEFKRSKSCTPDGIVLNNDLTPLKAFEEFYAIVQKDSKEFNSIETASQFKQNESFTPQEPTLARALTLPNAPARDTQNDSKELLPKKLDFTARDGLNHEGDDNYRVSHVPRPGSRGSDKIYVLKETKVVEAFESDFDRSFYVKPASNFEENVEFKEMRDYFDRIKADQRLVRLWFNVAQNQANYAMFLAGVQILDYNREEYGNATHAVSSWTELVEDTLDLFFIVDQCMYYLMDLVPDDVINKHVSMESWRNERNAIRNINKDQKFMALKVSMMERCEVCFKKRIEYSDEVFNQLIKNEKYDLCLDIMTNTKWSYVFVSSLVDECIVKATK